MPREDRQEISESYLRERYIDPIDDKLHGTVNFIGLKKYEKFKVAVGEGFDWSPVFDKAFDEAEIVGGIVVMPLGTFDHYSTIFIPENTRIIGAGNLPTGTVTSYKGSGGWAIKTSGLHQRNSISNIRVELNGNGNGILLGGYGADLPPGQVPVQFELSHISVSGIGASYTGVMTANASHYTFQDVRIGYGATSGKGLVITADMYNSGVATFIDCTLGRVDANSVGLEIDGSFNLDAFEFIGCYFGGKTPIKVGMNTVVRNFNISGGHAEGRNVGQTVNIIELYKVIGGNIKGFTFAGFGEANTNAIAFKDSVEKVNVMGCEANGIMGTLYKDDGATLIEDCMLQPPRNTNGGTAVTFSTGFSDKNFKFTTRKFQTENIGAKYYNDIATGVKIFFASSMPTTGGKGDFVINTNPSEMGTVGSKYVVTGWKCLVTNTTWVECRALTGN